MKGQIFPWLWDLEDACLDNKPTQTPQNLAEVSLPLPLPLPLPSYRAENFWDWELLARQLAQVDIFQPGSLMESAPLGLRNRRRIWRLLEEARIDDIEPYADQKMWEQWCREHGRPEDAKNSPWT
jgi:hypothetical protein